MCSWLVSVVLPSGGGFGGGGGGFGGGGGGFGGGGTGIVGGFAATGGAAAASSARGGGGRGKKVGGRGRRGRAGMSKKFTQSRKAGGDITMGDADGPGPMSGGMRRSKVKGQGEGGMSTSNVPRKMPVPVQSKKGKRKTKQQVKKQMKKLESVVSRIAAYHRPFWRSPACSPSTCGSCWSRSPLHDHTLLRLPGSDGLLF